MIFHHDDEAYFDKNSKTKNTCNQSKNTYNTTNKILLTIAPIMAQSTRAKIHDDVILYSFVVAWRFKWTTFIGFDFYDYDDINQAEKRIIELKETMVDDRIYRIIEFERF